MLHASAPLGLNGLEISCVGIVLFGVGSMGRRLDWTFREVSVALVLIAPVLVLTSAEATQFMTMDEWGISSELFDAAQRSIREISLGAFLTGILVALPVTRVFEVAGADPITIRMMLKAVWWLSGNGLIIAICVELLRLRSPRGRLDPAFFGAAFAGVAVLPTTQLALKTVNYDLFSFEFATLAVLFLVRMAVWGDHSVAWPALVAATLAAQEKLIAGPVLILAVVAAAMSIFPESEPMPSRILHGVRSAVGALTLSLLITAVSLAVFRVLGSPSVASPFWSLVLGPISSWAWMPLGLLWPIETILLWRAWIGMASGGVLITVIAAVAAAQPLWLGVWRRALSMPFGAIVTCVAILWIVLYAAGVVSVLTVQGYWAPFHPSPLAKLSVMQELNGIALHVGATTYGAHLCGLVFYAIAVLVIAIPSPVWAAGFAGIAACAWRRDKADQPNIVIAGLLMTAALPIPIAAALTGMPFAHRYFNLSIAFLACGLVMAAFAPVRPIWLSRRWFSGALAAGVFVVLCCAETAPFRPLFAAFRPFWLNYTDSQRAELGRLNASWMGWGEEIMSAGKKLEAACLAHDAAFAGTPCTDVTLYVMHSGLWLPGPSVIHLARYAEVSTAPPLGKNSFYVVNRLYLITGAYPIPQIEPDFTVSYRGYVLAWVFRGDRLAESGYRFH